jgi:C4-dicarboxylate-specific signal transduction histidine kinase
MNLRGAISEELWKNNLTRNRYAYLAQFLIITLSVWYQTRFQGSAWVLTMTLALLGSILRFAATEIVKNDRMLSRKLMTAGFFVLGITWAQHFHANFHDSYPISQNLIYLWFTIGGTILVCHMTLVADPPSYIAFVTPIFVTIAGEYAYQGVVENFIVILNLVTMLLLTSVSFRHQHKQLRDYIRARLEADRERRRMKKMIDGVPGFVGIVDGSRRYIDGNKMTFEHFPDFIGKSLGDGDPSSSYSKFVTDFLQSGKDAATAETEISLGNNHYHFLTTLGLLENNEMIIISIPINELVKTRRELRDKEALAQYSSKLISIGQMAASVAHEVNNPLAIISGSAGIISDLVDEEKVDRKNLKAFSEKIVQTSERISQIVRSLRSLSRGGDKDPFQPLSVRKVIDTCLDLANVNFKNLGVRIDLPEKKKDLTIMGREVQLGQVLLNLLSNALDAVKPLQDRWVKIDYGHSDGHIWLEVTDSGNGIPPEIASRLMEPFFTTKKQEGTGLGLSISMKILEEHGGRLMYVEGNPNTTFRLRFPTPKL